MGSLRALPGFPEPKTILLMEVKNMKIIVTSLNHDESLINSGVSEVEIFVEISSRKEIQL